jgi:hypothetical protein
MLSILLFLTFLLSCRSAGPPCVWQCDNSTCEAICHPYCNEAVCQICHNDTGTPVCEATNQCNVQCPIPTLYQNDTCPECEVVCSGTLCDVNDTKCAVLCEAPECSWNCFTPPETVCPAPACGWQCGAAVCPHNSAGNNRASMLMVPLLLTLSMYLF